MFPAPFGLASSLPRSPAAASWTNGVSHKATANSIRPRTATDRRGAGPGGPPQLPPRSAALRGTSRIAGCTTGAALGPSATDSCSRAGQSSDQTAMYRRPAADGRAPERAASAWSVEPWGKESPRLSEGESTEQGGGDTGQRQRSATTRMRKTRASAGLHASCAHLRNYICGRTSPTAGPILMQGKSNLKAIRLRFSANFSHSTPRRFSPAFSPSRARR